MAKKVMIVGSGGREHALAWALQRSPSVDTVIATPGSDGIADVATLVEAPAHEDVERAARELSIDLVVIGPEQPLVDGLADRLRAAGIAVFGPGAAAAKIEGDKQWAKELMFEAGIPAARSQSFVRLDAALDHLADVDGPCVIKATGLAAGKGVTVCDDHAQAEAAVRACLTDRAFGEAGATVLIEERLEGPELSVFAVVDGQDFAIFAPSRDHKRLMNADAGPNTGGMGAYTPVADATDELLERVEREVLRPTVEQLRARGMDYRGLLYVGLMLTAEGPKVLEYNCRFGDPETQVVLPSFDGDLYDVLASAAHGHLSVTGALAQRDAAVGVVLASAGYPASSQKGVPIEGLQHLTADDLVFHAGTRRVDGVWQTHGGRVLCAVGRDPDFETARHRAVDLADRLSFEGAQRRSDIGQREGANR